MILHKCKICGGDLIPVPGSVIATCKNCGTEQPFPWGEDPRKLKLFAHANRLRLACEFDKAAGIYEAIIADYPEEAEKALRNANFPYQWGVYVWSLARFALKQAIDLDNNFNPFN